MTIIQQNKNEIKGQNAVFYTGIANYNKLSELNQKIFKIDNRYEKNKNIN